MPMSGADHMAKARPVCVRQLWKMVMIDPAVPQDLSDQRSGDRGTARFAGRGSLICHIEYSNNVQEQRTATVLHPRFAPERAHGQGPSAGTLSYLTYGDDRSQQKPAGGHRLRQ